jgi:hypothetical protein
MELQVVKELQKYGVESVCAQYGLKAKWSNDGELVCIKYDIFSDMSLKICQESRGLILDKNFNYVALPFEKFFNYNEPKGAEIVDRLADTTGWVAQEKVDGSLITMYYHQGSWRVSTTGMPEAEGLVEGSTKTFAELFWETLAKYAETDEVQRGNTYSYDFCKDCIYMFELYSPDNQNVCNYGEEPFVKLLAIRNSTGEYLNLNRVVLPDFEELPRVASIPFDEFTLSQIIPYLETKIRNLDGRVSEGYVLYHPETQTYLKMKAPDYCQRHKYRHGISVPRHLVELELSGIADDVYASLSDANKRRLEYLQGLLRFSTLFLQRTFEAINDPNKTAKEYAEAVQTVGELDSNPCTKSLLFALRKDPDLSRALSGKSVDFYCKWLNIPRTLTELDDLLVLWGYVVGYSNSKTRLEHKTNSQVHGSATPKVSLYSKD